MLQLFEKHQIIYSFMLKNTLSINVAWGHCDPREYSFLSELFHLVRSEFSSII